MRDVYQFLNFSPARTYTKRDGSRATLPTRVNVLVPSEDDQVKGLKVLEMETTERLEPKLAGLTPLEPCVCEFSFDKQTFGQNTRVRFILSDIMRND